MTDYLEPILQGLSSPLLWDEGNPTLWPLPSNLIPRLFPRPRSSPSSGPPSADPPSKPSPSTAPLSTIPEETSISPQRKLSPSGFSPLPMLFPPPWNPPRMAEQLPFSSPIPMPPISPLMAHFDPLKGLPLEKADLLLPRLHPLRNLEDFSPLSRSYTDQLALSSLAISSPFADFSPNFSSSPSSSSPYLASLSPFRPVSSAVPPFPLSPFYSTLALQAMSSPLPFSPGPPAPSERAAVEGLSLKPSTAPSPLLRTLSVQAQMLRIPSSPTAPVGTPSDPSGSPPLSPGTWAGLSRPSTVPLDAPSFSSPIASLELPLGPDLSEPLTLQMDRAVQRDSRRYDRPFTLY